MSNTRILKLAAVSGMLLLGACTADNFAGNAKIEADELVFVADPEPVKGKSDVYDSMARGAKYNVDAASRNLSKKIYNQNPNLKPQDVINNVVNANVNDENKLYQASRVLEFAVIYAVSNLSDSQVYADNNFYEKASQHLALAAIRSHQDALFAAKKIKEIDRLMRQEKKTADSLSAKLEHNGILNAEDKEYKKQLDVSLMRLSEIRESLAFSLEEYAQLAKVAPKEINLEGRRFYELEDFDKGYSIEIFQEAAVRNRKEFALAKEQVKSYGVTDLRRDISNRYPLVRRLDINGLDVEDEVYEQELYDKTLKISTNLLNAVHDFQQAKEGSAEKNALRRKVFDELGAAVLTQAEVSYRLVELADTDYQTTENAIRDTKKEIRILEQKRYLAPSEKNELLNRKIILLEQERRAAQISAERAVALRSLYFNAGLSPLNKQLLKSPVKNVAAEMKKSFNRDLTEMLSSTKISLENRSDQDFGWAKGDNWLEEVVAKTPRSRVSARVVSVSGDGTKYSSMQLGAYAQRESAEYDWAELSAKFPELKNYQQSIEETNLGNIRYRLLLKGDGGRLAESCRKIIAGGYDCLMR